MTTDTETRERVQELMATAADKISEKLKEQAELHVVKFCTFCGGEDIKLAKLSYGMPFGNPIICMDCGKVFLVNIPTLPKCAVEDGWGPEKPEE